MLAIILSLLAGFCYANSNLFAQRGLHLQATPWAAWITLLVNTAFLWILHLIVNPGAPVWVPANLLFVLIGLFVPGLTRMLNFRGIRTLGSSVTSTVLSATPMFATILAVLFLGERPSSIVLSGGGLIVGGLMAISWGREQRSWKRIELLFPLLSALLFASKDVVARWGMVATGQPIQAVAIATLTATLEIFIIVRFIQRAPLSVPPPKVLLWFVISGLFTGGSFLFQFLALYIERVSIVTPIVNSYSVFVLFLAPLVARDIERITPRKVLGAVVVVAGVFLISMGKN